MLLQCMRLYSGPPRRPISRRPMYVLVCGEDELRAAEPHSERDQADEANETIMDAAIWMTCALSVRGLRWAYAGSATIPCDQMG